MQIMAIDKLGQGPIIWRGVLPYIGYIGMHLFIFINKTINKSPSKIICRATVSAKTVLNRVKFLVWS